MGRSDYMLDKQKTYLVTGAAGFIGYNVAKYILKQGCKVVGLDNLKVIFQNNL